MCLPQPSLKDVPPCRPAAALWSCLSSLPLPSFCPSVHVLQELLRVVAGRKELDGWPQYRGRLRLDNMGKCQVREAKGGERGANMCKDTVKPGCCQAWLPSTTQRIFI